MRDFGRWFYYTMVTKSLGCEATWVQTSLVTKAPDALFVQPIGAHDFTIYLFDTHTSFNATLMGSLREKGGQHPILEVYYFHIRLNVCEPFSV